jgi:hypothetical protein
MATIIYWCTNEKKNDELTRWYKEALMKDNTHKTDKLLNYFQQYWSKLQRT